MKIAVIHDSMLEFGGAERVLQAIIDLYPQADVYTAFADPSFRSSYLPQVAAHKFHVSFLQHVPIGHHTSFVQAIAPVVWRSFRLDAYDLVISSGTHIMSSLVHAPNAIHIASLQYPPKNIFGIDPPTPLQRLTRYDAYLRPLYLRALHHSGHVIVNSKFTARRMKKYLGIDTTVIYPPVIIPKAPPKKSKGKFYLCISRIVPYKNLELAILAATKLHVPLKIFGVTYDKSYERHLRNLAGPTVEILPFRTDFTNFYAQSIAFLFPTAAEDFGIAPLEATAHGVPVIAYYGGGAKETVVEGVTGTFFYTHSATSLIAAMQRLQTMHMSKQAMYAHAKRFGVTRFKREFKQYVDNAIQSSPKRATRL